MATIEELDQDSGMGSSDVRSPDVKSLLPDDDEDDEEVISFVIFVARLIGVLYNRAHVSRSDTSSPSPCFYSLNCSQRSGTPFFNRNFINEKLTNEKSYRYF